MDDAAYLCTAEGMLPQQIVEYMVRRWAVEVTFEEVVALPADFTLIAKTRPAEARRLQLSVREQLQCHFARKLVITAFAFEGGAGRYVLDPARAAGLGAR